MERPTIASIVEGHGEVYAVPALLHRIALDLGVHGLNVMTPLRVSVSKIKTASTEFTTRVQAAAERVGAVGGVLIIVGRGRSMSGGAWAKVAGGRTGGPHRQTSGG